FVTPEMTVGGGFDELHRNQHLVALSLDGALDDRIDVEFLADFGSRQSRVFVVYCGRKGLHMDAANLGEFPYEQICHAIHKKVLVRVAGETSQRQYGDPLNPVGRTGSLTSGWGGGEARARGGRTLTLGQKVSADTDQGDDADQC